MIESRYKIEYVLPDEDKPKSSSLRFLWYFFLIPLVIASVAAVTYDFSFKDLSRDSIALLEKAKVHLFNLGDYQETKLLVKIKKELANKKLVESPVIIKETPKFIEKKKASINSVTSKTTIDRDRIRISELTSKQEAQLIAIQKKIAENSALSKNLNSLSEQLVLEQVKNQTLNSKLAEQEKDKLELEEQLNKILVNPTDKKVVIEKPKTEKIKETIIPLAPTALAKEKTDIVQIKKAQIVEVPKEKEVEVEVEVEVEQSETDKIIQAMTTIAKDKINADDAATNEVAKEESLNKSIAQPKTSVEPIAEVSKAETEDESTVDTTEDKKLTLSPTVNLLPKTTAILDKVKEEIVITETKPDVEVSDITKEDKETETKVEEIKKPQSAVDAIIAAMQSPPSNITPSASKTEKIDTELEKDIEKQLVEKGEISVDKQ